MKVLLDTCILAELRHPQGDPTIKNILSSFEDEDLFVSVITIGEISKGIALLPESQKKQGLTQWLNGLEHQFSDRLISINRDVSFMWGELTARSQANGIIIPATDGLIAATALCYGLHVMTKNVKHFEPTGVFMVQIPASENRISDH